eukprot:TRINITY_DN12331_c2_g1_i1.p2 TRINITY_DN12331_c2_g1~~TRINITY_DN12331_c2_g1_i1.p2  ORF type:complete len:102 (+),score=17.19 TRINITY_DN12331_c2_g1_i1:19-324(+)
MSIFSNMFHYRRPSPKFFFGPNLLNQSDSLQCELKAQQQPITTTTAAATAATTGGTSSIGDTETATRRNEDKPIESPGRNSNVFVFVSAPEIAPKSSQSHN